MNINVIALLTTLGFLAVSCVLADELEKRKEGPK